MKNRYLEKSIADFLNDKMVFIGGPRQVGKTTTALNLLKAQRGDEHPAYYNWDILSDRKRIQAEDFPSNQPLLIFDEIHKFAKWRTMIKGFYDRYYPKKNALVTGSARLDYYRKGGDSLLGRYRYLRMHPFSIDELSSNPSQSDLSLLLKFGGFPEPLFRGSEKHWRLWQNERVARVLYEDLRDLEKVSEISLLELLMETLPSKIGSPLSLQSLREDLQVSHDSIRRWLTIFENLYLCFRISPFGSPKIKAVKKEQKLYFWDWSQSINDGTRFENFVASQLLKYCHFLEDTEGYKMELRYVRDVLKREVDFVVLRNKKPMFAVECKTGEKQVSDATRYFKLRTNIPKFYQVHLGEKDYGDEDKDVRVMPYIRFHSEVLRKTFQKD